MAPFVTLKHNMSTSRPEGLLCEKRLVYVRSKRRFPRQHAIKFEGNRKVTERRLLTPPAEKQALK